MKRAVSCCLPVVAAAAYGRLILEEPGKYRTYAPDFRLKENPITEDGKWINGKVDGLDWCDVATIPGLAFGLESGSRGYDDPVALLKGNWSSDLTVEATVHSVNQNGGISDEIELRLRSALSAHRATAMKSISVA
jgi:hypothetical protein